ncbi:MAG: glycoside hydrolase family 125 protein [Oscillospiraceae bacterium]|nr:glycoside hydrolase family 125 protein [Oscillospiraceae bacterium]
MKIPVCVEKHINEYCEKIEKYSPKLAELYRNCYPNTIETATEYMPDGSVFVLTGDIPAMWLRDSTAEVSHYIPLAAENEEIGNLIKGVIKRQRMYIEMEPYANAFKKKPNRHREFDDYPLNNPIVWERKYEIDSLCYPIRLTYLYWKATGDKSVLGEDFVKSAKITVDLWRTEQHHFEKSPYRFTRKKAPEKDTLGNNGMGNPVEYTGMTWSGFRPSDDSCRYGYLVASNMFASVVLGYLAEMLEAEHKDETELISECKALKAEIEAGINKFAVIETENHGKIYACEVNGKGDYFLFDDANVPSLLSAPYLGFCDCEDEIYRNTRSFILSKDNPYYYEGKFAKGVGSPHTPEGYIWHIALSMQGLTSNSPDEIKEILHMLETTDGGKGYMHEGFDANNPKKFTRSWFSWSCSLFAELVEKAVNENII